MPVKPGDTRGQRRWSRTPRTMEEQIEAFWDLVDKGKADKCWPWKGRTEKGYGQFGSGAKGTLGGPFKTKIAHRIAYTLAVGEVPAGLVLDHLCRNRRCCNPAHLEPKSNRANVLAGEGITAKQARQTHCKRGHEFTPETTYVDPRGRRYCRTCRNEKQRAERKKA